MGDPIRPVPDWIDQWNESRKIVDVEIEEWTHFLGYRPTPLEIVGHRITLARMLANIDRSRRPRT